MQDNLFNNNKSGNSYSVRKIPVSAAADRINSSENTDKIKILEFSSLIDSWEKEILFSEKGIEKVHSINETLGKYGDLSAWKLVEITHKENTPWAHSYSGENYDEISDKEILKWHCNK